MIQCAMRKQIDQSPSWDSHENHTTSVVTLEAVQIGKFNSKLNFYKLIPYLVDRCICPAPCRSRQTLEKNVLSWALAGTGSVLFIRQVAV